MADVSYATLAQLRREVKADVTTDDAVILDLGRRMTSAIDEYLRSNFRETVFIPRRVTKYYDARRGARLELDADFVALTSVVDGEAVSLVANTDYYALPRGETPITALHRFDGSYWSAYSGDTPVAQIAITGDLCYRKYYSEAWVNTGTTAEALDDSETGVDVTDGTAFSPGQLIRVESEWMTVDSISTNTLTVTRGARGSTAASHLTGLAVAVFHPEPSIVQACCRWAGLVFKRRGAFEQTNFDGTATVQFPPSIPEEVRDLLRHGAWANVRPVVV